FIIAASVSLAMLPRAWPAAYAVVLEVPGFGWFRGPGRYVVLSSLGLCLAAGAGFDRAAGPASIRRGVVTAWAFAIAAAGWAVYWALRPDHRAVLGGSRFALVMGSAALSWVVATALLLAWRRRRALAWVLVLATAAELGWLYYTSTTVWDGPLTFHRRVRCWPEWRRSRTWAGSRGWCTTCPSAPAQRRSFLTRASPPLRPIRISSWPPGVRRRFRPPG